MPDYKDGLLDYTRLDDGTVKIACTPEYFQNRLDHSTFNQGTLFIHVVGPMGPWCFEDTVMFFLLWAQDTTSQTYMIPIKRLQQTAKGYCLVFDKAHKEKVKYFIQAKEKLWQFEIRHQNNQYVITSKNGFGYVFE